MREFTRDVLAIFKDHRRGLLIAGAGVVLLVVIAIGITSWRMNSPSFCSNCHYMDPYVRHWEASGHAQVSCVDCHTNYGVSDLAMSTLKYWTNTYSMRPTASVDDNACLASGCHEQRLLEGKAEYGTRITFDHTVHFGKTLRGEKLRCTSCHNQIVQFSDEISHGQMAVNNKSCFICHFKDAGEGEAITGCDACHGMPTTTVQHAGFTFDHAPYIKQNVACKQCHTKIVKGDGAVPEAKCYSCHVERSRQDHTLEELHAIHVTTNGIDCFRCHSDMEHGNFEMVSSLDIQCESCHLRQHNGPKQLYMGIGGKDTLDMPSEMFLAQVSCTGCHTHLTPQGQPLAHQEKKEAQRTSCVTCHGKGYDLMFDNWLEGSRKALADYEKYLSAVRPVVASLGGNTARAALADAEANFNFIRDSHLPHNIRYSLYLMNSSAARLEKAIKAIKPSYQMPDVGAAVKPENSCLTFCHAKSLPETVTYEGKSLPHLQHATDLEVACASCHSVTEHGKTQINKDVCAGCHES